MTQNRVEVPKEKIKLEEYADIQNTVSLHGVIKFLLVYMPHPRHSVLQECSLSLNIPTLQSVKLHESLVGS